ncbi:MAG: glycerophosphodiester phosphodiesterase [Candidatus Eiseniibacteriota bacterium]
MARLLGHRGARAKAPENTLAAFRQALVDGADGIELDVRATGDGAAVLLHDETLDRTTSGRGPLASLSAAEVRALDAGSWFGEKWARERVPTLAEVLDEFLGRTVLAVELKEVLPPAAMADLAERLRAKRDAELLVASFLPEALRHARDLVPHAPRALILRPADPLPDETAARELGLWGVFPPHEIVDERWVVNCRRGGLHAWAYTVNDPARATQLAKWGIGGIISDDPAAVRGALK